MKLHIDEEQLVPIFWGKAIQLPPVPCCSMWDLSLVSSSGDHGPLFTLALSQQGALPIFGVWSTELCFKLLVSVCYHLVMIIYTSIACVYAHESSTPLYISLIIILVLCLIRVYIYLMICRGIIGREWSSMWVYNSWRRETWDSWKDSKSGAFFLLDRLV